MPDRFDLQLSDNNLVINPENGGDFAFVNSNEQHIADTINAFPGWWKENYADGVGILTYIKSKGTEQMLEQSIKLNLNSDLYTGNPIATFDANGLLTVNPNSNYDYV